MKDEQMTRNKNFINRILKRKLVFKTVNNEDIIE